MCCGYNDDVEGEEREVLGERTQKGKRERER